MLSTISITLSMKHLAIDGREEKVQLVKIKDTDKGWNNLPKFQKNKQSLWRRWRVAVIL